MSAQWGMNFVYKSASVDVPVEATDPNTAATDPTLDATLALRVVRYPNQKGSRTSDRKIAIFVGSGTSLVAEIWIRDESGVNAQWWRTASATILKDVPQYFQAFPGAQTFVRVVTNNGNVKQYAVAAIGE